MPAVDIADTDKAYEITAELPGMDEKDVEVKLANGVLTIKGEKKEEKEQKQKQKQKQKDYHPRSGASVPSRAPSRFRKASIPTRSTPPSRTAYSR
jgi:hypothetical protein